MVLIKICGITNLRDAFDAVDAGADALGFNFYRSSPRYIPPSAAREIIEQLPADLLTVGVFVNEATPEAVRTIADEAGIGALQFHGDESPEFCRSFPRRHVIKVLAIRPDFDPEEALRYEVDAFMADAFDRQAWGGTGRKIDWSMARRLRERVPKLFLAGGLSSENVEEAIAAVEPYAVDACSALETTPGKKDREQVRAFVRAARV